VQHAISPQPSVSLPTDREHARETFALKAFINHGKPRTTFSLLLVSVSVAAIAMSIDEVERYSTLAFTVGMVLSAVLAFVVARTVESSKEHASRTTATLLLPTGCGAAIGMTIQSLVLYQVGTDWREGVKDLGGLVDTMHPAGWVLSGIILGGIPAMVVTVFLLLAARGLSKLVGHDAAESYGVGFVGFAGLLATFGLFIGRGLAAPVLLLVIIASWLTVLVAVLIDGSRIAFLRGVYTRTGEGYDIVPADQFAKDASLAPMVAAAGGGSVLVRLPKQDYRLAAMEPIALLAETEEETLRPLRRRRTAGGVILLATTALSMLALFTH
jgi:hypothetical protein